MKKLLGIVVLDLLINFLKLNDIEANTLTIKNQVIKTKGDVFYKWPHKWQYNYDMSFWKPYMIQEVSTNVRYGDSALRFELRKDSCGSTKNDVKKGTSWDCGKNKSERTELTPANENEQIGFKGNVWQTLSFYVEKFPHEEGHNSIWQIHNDGDWAPMFNWSIEEDGLYTQRRTACNDPKIYKKKNAKGNDGCSVKWRENANIKVLEISKLFDRWIDVVMNINYTTKDSGFLKLWLNGELVYHFEGSIIPPAGKKNGEWSNWSTMQFGIYRTDYHGTRGTQINYYDEIRFAKKKCSKLKLEELGYSCTELENQKINIDRYN